MNQPILHIPHSSTYIPIRDGYIASDKEIESEIVKLTDWHTEDLFAHPLCIPVIASFSRIFCDVERFPMDEDEEMARFGMGMIYEKLDKGNPLRIVDEKLRETIYNNYYKQHHVKLTSLVDEQLEKTGRALIIDCHSFSDTPFERDLNKKQPRPDICIGTDSFHTSEDISQLACGHFLDSGYVCEINKPYSGSIVPMKHYNKNKDVKSIMIEINRKQYIQDGSNNKSSNYNQMKKNISSLLDAFIYADIFDD